MIDKLMRWIFIKSVKYFLKKNRRNMISLFSDMYAITRIVPNFPDDPDINEEYMRVYFDKALEED